MPVSAFVVIALTGTVVMLWFGRVYVHFRREIQRHRNALCKGSVVIETQSGPIEYGRVGEGLPVLVSHGGVGGYDQGLAIANTYLDEDFLAIAPSRFGHLRTPLAKDSHAEAQADAYAHLLDALQIERAAIMGVSGGGPSSLQFALRHPKRCSALVMSAAVSQYVPARPTWVYRNDFVYWLITTYLRQIALSKIGVPRNVQANLTPDERERLEGVFTMSHPVSLRTPGLFHDIEEWNDQDRWTRNFPLNQIKVPTLVTHAVDDAVIPFSHAEFSTRSIPSARLLSLPDGGHMRLGHGEELRKKTSDFLRLHIQPIGK